MPQQRIKVQFPFGGISDAIAKSTQPNLTTRDAQNCRGKDPQTGRIRGAQRAGLASFTSGQDQPYDEDDVAVSTPVQALAGVSFDQPRIDYTRLRSSRNDSIGHGQPQHPRESEVWHRSVVGDGSAFSPVVDIQGNIYIITDGRTIHKYNPDGTLVSSLTIPATSTASVVRSLAVDSLGNIYAVAAAGHNAIGGQLMRWEPHEDLEYTLRYNITLNARPTHFKLRFNTLWLVVEGSYGDPSQSRLEAWGFLDSDTPLKLWARYIPHPCYGLDLGEAGHIFIASGANPDRLPSAGATGVVPGVVGWLPNELYRGSGRIHSWLDAYYLPNISTGTAISEWTDARGFVPSEVPNFLPIYDTQPRSAVNPFPTPSTTAGHHSPTYLANGFVDKPSIRFDRTETHNFGGGVGETELGQGLYFKANGSRLNRTEIRIDADTGPYSTRGRSKPR